MAVLFNQIPGNLRVPFFRAEFQPGGTPYQSIARLLLVGQKLSGGSATANVPVSFRAGEAASLFGRGSMLHAMDSVARSIAPVQEIWALPLDDAAAGVAATGKITVQSAAFPLTQPRSIAFYVAGQRYIVLCLTSDDEDTFAAKVKGVLDQNTAAPFTAAVNGSNANEVDLTCRWKGATGNSLRLEHGLSTDDPTGAEIFSFTQFANGAGDPEIDTGLANLGDEEFDWICGPYSDATNLGHVGDYMNDSSGTWSYIKQTYGHYLTVANLAYVGLQTLGNGLNSQHYSILPVHKFESPSWLSAAALGALVAKHLQSAPELSRPLQTLEMMGIRGPRDLTARLREGDRQALYYDGISGVRYSRTGEVQLERVTTTYQTNLWGDPDATYLDLNTMAQSMFGIRFLRQKITNTYPRSALAGDEAPASPNVARPIDIKQTLIHGYEQLCSPALSVFERPDLFAASLVVERNNIDPNRVDAFLPLDHVNQLRIMAVAAVNYMQREEFRQAA